jgi:uncharacterized SAM-binding protein YcdF (DUF218 family)
MTTYIFLKNGLLPGSVGLLLLIVGVCLAALWLGRWRKAALIVATLITVFYAAISSPPIAMSLSRAVAGKYAAPQSARALSGIQAIAILDGGTSRANLGGVELASPTRLSAERALEGLRVFRLLGGKPRVLISGGAFEVAGPMPEGGAIREFLILQGVPARLITLDTTSRNTRDHAAKVPAILRALGDTSFALVTSAVHMRRAMRAFKEAGSHPVPAPAVISAPPSSHWWPTTVGLEQSSEALYEVLGILFGH